MRPIPSLPLAMCALALAACAPTTTTTTAAPPGATATAAETPPARAEPRLLGEWVMAPPPGQARDVELVRHALSSPPDDTSFAAMQPSAREREHYSNILRLRREEPGSPLLAAMQRKLDELQGVRLTFTAETMITATAQGTTVTNYLVEEVVGDQVVILEDGAGDPAQRRAIIAFDGADRLVLIKGPVRVPMTRVPAGVAPRPNEVATKAAPAGDEFEACVAEYYRCIEAMPAETRAQIGDAIAATRQVFEAARNSPQRRKAATESCKQAVSLAHATYCPAR